MHRWRKLEGNDPSSFELIQKVQALQKKLIARKEDIVERDLALLVKEKTNGELRTALARQQPSEAAEEEARLLKAELKAKEEARKSTVAENNLLRTQVADAAGKVERLASALLHRETSFCQPRFLPSRVTFRSLVAFLEHNPPPTLTQKSSSERLEYQLPPPCLP